MKLVGPRKLFSQCKILVASAYENLELSHLKFSQFFDMIHSQQIAITSFFKILFVILLHTKKVTLFDYETFGYVTRKMVGY